MDSRLQEGIGLFNTGRYFECHESLEKLYQQSEEEHKPFLEGLVQLAAACRLHADFGEVQGPVRMIRQAIIRLENYQPHYLGIQVQTLIGALEKWADGIESDGAGASPSQWKPPQIRSRWAFNL